MARINSRLLWLHLVFIIICYFETVQSSQDKIVLEKSDTSVIETQPLRCWKLISNDNVTMNCSAGDLCMIMNMGGKIFANCANKEYCDDLGKNECCDEDLCNTISFIMEPSTPSLPMMPTDSAITININFAILFSALCAFNIFANEIL